MSGEDLELKRIQMRKLRQLMQTAQGLGQPKAVEKDPMERLKPFLGDRAEDVLNAALEQYPEQTKAIIGKLVELAEKGALQGKVDGGTLLQLFRRLGMRVKLETEILVYKEGEYKRLSEMLR
ncbi:MAG: hypothetical protein B9J98_00280 [Candidatus Terraquivivens tikiterensis]|uniref:Double-stranded DNA-binding protein n=1 Tax=Candidatus Terraquivivens tikiterensis TaxID=1980982 RepID=A0A2R7Y9V0_9ARCH|nr:MAG: hypothetical protein B9J98_00280 [Candidatus Terraquivivens tikiterensis]